MARHKKIDVRMWGDEKFRSLSKSAPNGQTLWFYLLTGPHTTSIPGLFMAGEMALSEALGWPVKAFREAFQEVLSKGMAEADFEARVVWIPKAMLYNPPESPNVVKSWRIYWDEIPECPLKHKAYQHLKAFTEGLGKGFGEGFKSTCSVNIARPSPNQEQEQEQEQDTPQPPETGGGGAAGKTDRKRAADGTDERFARFWSAYPRKVAKPDAVKAWAKHDPTDELLAVMLAAIERQKRSADWVKEDGRFIPHPATWLNKRRWEDQPPEVNGFAPPTDYGYRDFDTAPAKPPITRTAPESAP